MECYEPSPYARENARYKVLDSIHFSLENSYLTFMKEMQHNLSNITNKKKEIERNFQNRILIVETKLKSIRELFNANRNICHTEMVVELKSKKVFAPLEVKKKRI